MIIFVLQSWMNGFITRDNICVIEATTERHYRVATFDFFRAKILTNATYSIAM